MNFEDNESITKSSTATTGFATELITVYHGPDESVYAQVGSIGPNETVNILAKSMGWYHIEYTVGTTTQRKTGYVPMSSLSNITGDTVTEEDFYGGYCYATTELDVRTCDVFENTAPVGTLFENEGCTMLFSYYVGDKEVAFIEYSTSSGTKRGYVYAQYLRFPIETRICVANDIVPVYGSPNFEDAVRLGTIYKNELMSIIAKGRTNIPRNTELFDYSNIIYVEYNTVKGRKRGYIQWDKVTLYDYSDTIIFNDFYQKSINADCHINDEPEAIKVYGGPSVAYAELGSVNCENIVCFWTNTNENNFTCIEYSVTKTGKIKRGYIDVSKVNMGNLEIESNPIEDLTVQYPHFTRVVYGQTQRNRDMVYYKTGNGPNHLFLTFALHGWEDGTTEDGRYYHGDGNMLIKVAKRFLQKFGELSVDKINEIKNKCTIFVFPGINLDGIVEGYSNNSFGRCLFSGLDPNRNWPGDFEVNINNSRYKTGSKYLGNEDNGSDAIELINLKSVITQNVGSQENVLIDVHGWYNQTIGNIDLGAFYCNEFNIPIDRHSFSYGSGYLIAWARNHLDIVATNQNLPGIGAKTCLLELPATNDYSDLKMYEYGDKFFEGTIKLINDIEYINIDAEEVSLNKLYNQLQALYKLADEYKPYISIKEKNELVLQYLRKDKYNSFSFNFLYGKIDENFIEYVENNNNISIIDYLEPENIRVPDLLIAEGIKIDHMAACLNGYLYNLSDTFNEIDADALGCWAGDLVHMGDMFERVNKNLTLDDAEKIMATNDLTDANSYNENNLFEKLDDLGFPYEDWTHDIDAVCIKDDLSEMPIYTAFWNYYNNVHTYGKRHIIFSRKAIPNSFVNGVFNKNNVKEYVSRFLKPENLTNWGFNVAMHYGGKNAEVLSEAFANKLEKFVVDELNNQSITPNIRYKAHCENIGWQTEKSNWEYAGTVNQGLRLEAVIINADIPILYRTHCENIGWTPWVSNGEIAGTTGRGLRMEAIEIKTDNYMVGQGHIQNIGDQNETFGKSIVIGTDGRALRLEGFKLKFI